MESLISPFIETKLTKKVTLEPFELNNDILYNLKNKLKKLEKICHKFGYLHRVVNIFNYEDGIIQPEDLMCRCIYTVTFSSVVCYPYEDTYIVAKIRKIDPTLISSELGPIQIITQANRLPEQFKLSENKLIHTPTNTELTKGDYVVIKVLAKRFNNGDTFIKIIGNIVNISNEEEFNKINNLLEVV